jgi:thioredoxin-related protein
MQLPPAPALWRKSSIVPVQSFPRSQKTPILGIKFDWRMALFSFTQPTFSMKIFLALLLVGSSIGYFGLRPGGADNAPQADEAVAWVSVEQAYQQMQADAKAGRKVKKVFIDVYTDWCGWCKRMDATTFADPKFVQFMNANYYMVKFNAEQRADIALGAKGTFKFQAMGNRGTHEYAIQLLNGQMSYPTVAFLDESFELIQAVPGYREADELRMIAAYFSGDFHKNTAWEDFQRSYKG